MSNLNSPPTDFTLNDDEIRTTPNLNNVKLPTIPMKKLLFQKIKRFMEIMSYFRLMFALTLYILLLIDLISIQQNKEKYFWIEILLQVINAEFTLLTLIEHPKRLKNLLRAIRIWAANHRAKSSSRIQKLSEPDDSFNSISQTDTHSTPKPEKLVIAVKVSLELPPSIKNFQKLVSQSYGWYLYDVEDNSLICSPAKLSIILITWNIGSFMQYGICAILWLMTPMNRPYVPYLTLTTISMFCELVPIPVVVIQSKRALLAKRLVMDNSEKSTCNNEENCVIIENVSWRIKAEIGVSDNNQSPSVDIPAEVVKQTENDFDKRNLKIWASRYFEGIKHQKNSQQNVHTYFFETFNAPSLYIANQALMTLYGIGCLNGLVIEITPIIDCSIQHHTALTIPIAGQDFDEYFLSILLSGTQFELARTLEESDICEVLLDVDFIEDSPNRIEAEYNGRKFTIDLERFQVIEPIFDPLLIEAIYRAISYCEPDKRTTLWDNIAFTGGSSLLKGFKEPLEKELDVYIYTLDNAGEYQIKEARFLKLPEYFSALKGRPAVITAKLINSDFIPIYGDVVSNIHLDKVLDVHRSLGESPIFVLDECVHCETVELYPRKRRIWNIDVLSRWTSPIVSDSNLQEGDNYEFMCGHIYKEKDVLLSRSCSLGEKVLIGAGSEIAENVKTTNSAISRRVIIVGAYIWDDVKIK
ncbi:23704_t:CDS:10 [Cetraspora pellucida]|uniref:23704_t:CDS:1 n=1 Tax=Cetraspora pellucida TaxID=1433469 RepID=A0A9N9C6K3_9GLOM|nr:23704_t:CDS:10 [Cetraspora pellucida]